MSILLLGTNIRGSTIMIKNADLENIIILTGKFIRGSFLMIKKMGKDNYLCQMEVFYIRLGTRASYW